MLVKLESLLPRVSVIRIILRTGALNWIFVEGDRPRSGGASVVNNRGCGVLSAGLTN